MKTMCETCHQPNQGGEGIEHDEGCPESDTNLNETLTSLSRLSIIKKKYKYKVSDIVRCPRGKIGQIEEVDATMILGSNGLKPKHYDYWVYFGAAMEAGYKESELRIVNLSKEKKDEYHQAFSFGQCIVERSEKDLKEFNSV